MQISNLYFEFLKWTYNLGREIVEMWTNKMGRREFCFVAGNHTLEM